MTQVVRFLGSFSGSCEEQCLLRCDAESKLNSSVNFIENLVPDLIEIIPVVSEMKCATVILPGMPSLDETKAQKRYDISFVNLLAPELFF